MTAAVLAAFALYHLFNLPQGYWAVFTTVIVVQTSIGGTLNAATDRLIGTVAGALVGGLAAALRPQTPVGLGAALAVCVALTSFGAATRPQLKVAPVTAVIMLISPSAGAGGPLAAVLFRVVEIAIGSVVGVLATVLIFPARSGRVAAARIEATLGQLADVLDACVARFEGGAESDVLPLHGQIRASLAAVESAVADAGRERSSRLGDHRLPDAIVRTLWRVRNDTVMVGRTIGAPLPGPARTCLAGPAQEMLRCEAGFMRACGQAVHERKRLDRAALDTTHEAFQRAVEALRRERLTGELTFDAVSPVFGLTFAIESLYRNLSDLAERIGEADDPAVLGKLEPAVAPP